MIQGMPGTNLTRDEAAARAALVNVTSYAVDLDLTCAPDRETSTFGSTTTIEFTCTSPGTDTFVDLVEARVHEIVLNGEPVDPAAYADHRIALSGLAATNTLTVRADCAYSHTGEGLHRFFDPADDRVYLYSQFEVPDARRVFTTFEQPDLKSVFTFTVTAPAHWTVVSNAPTPDPVATGEGVAVWSFPATKPMSTYITAIVAGEYHAVHDVYEGPHGAIPLGHYCRQSLVDYLERDRKEIVGLTQEGFAFFEDAFDYPYPFEKYDQLYVPEYNMGAMENAGAVTLRDEYLPRSRQPRSFYEFRASVILHEMAHMWFGDLVTMRWWDDLWLNESFAEWACYHAEVEATQYADAWTGFANARKQTGYRADQLSSTHPIAADNADLEAVEVNFDMITYAKGASVLKQLVAWVGLEPFLTGLRQYFKEHEYANSEFADLLAALERASGRELEGWAHEWLQTAGVNTLRARIETDKDGVLTRLAVEQSAPGDWPTLRRHRLGIGFYEPRADGADAPLVRTDYLEVDVEGELTEVPDAVGLPRPALLLLNDGDLAYAKIRLDEVSLATAIEGLSRLKDSLARALVWGAAWDMTRDAEMTATDYVDLVLGNIATESDAWGVSRIPALAGQAVSLYSSRATREQLSATWEQGLRRLLESAEAGSDHQLTFARAYTAAAMSDGAAQDLAAILEGSRTFEGLEVDTDLRWALVTALARLGRADDARIDAELEADQTISGQEKAAAARASMPTALAKERAWERAMVDPETPNETHRSIVLAFSRAGQDDVLAPYVEKYFEAVQTTYDRLGSHKGSVALQHIFPQVLASRELLARLDRWLATARANPGALRYVREARDDVARAVKAQEFDAGS